jgi:hypothetical protein
MSAASTGPELSFASFAASQDTGSLNVTPDPGLENLIEADPDE